MANEKQGTATEQLYAEISKTIDQYRDNACRAVNIVIVKAYWEIGRLIKEQELKGTGLASHGMGLP